MSNLVKHAERELELIGMGKDAPDEMNRLMHDNIIQMVKTFSEQGHSGFSASYAIGVLEKLLDFEPISDLTGADDEWNDVSEASGEPCWQNKRCSHVFKDADGRAYDINGKVFRPKDGSGSYTNGESRVYITFPYRPKTEYVEVDRDDTPVTATESTDDLEASDLSNPANHKKEK